MNVKPSVRAPLAIFPILAAIVSIAMLTPANASAATVVNGDFEAGDLSGWQVENLPESSGNWFAYSEAMVPDTVLGPPPPEGEFAAITNQGDPGTHILYQDIALEPGLTHQLSMIIFYVSEAALVTPASNTLNANEETGGDLIANQQYRIDVIDPTAALDTLDPIDIFATVFATQTDDPTAGYPFLRRVDLSAFAGRTVRLRLVEVDNQGPFFAGADSISIATAPAAQPPVTLPATSTPASTPASNLFTLGRLVYKPRRGTATLPVTVSGAGRVTIVGANAVVPGAGKLRARKSSLVKRVSAPAPAATTLRLALKPTVAARKILKVKHRLAVKFSVTFSPTGGTAKTISAEATLKLRPKKHP